MVNICLTKGAWGAKLTGAGGGGSIIVSFPPNNYELKVFFDSLDKSELGGQSIPVEVDFSGVLVA